MNEYQNAFHTGWYSNVIYYRIKVRYVKSCSMMLILCIDSRLDGARSITELVLPDVMAVGKSEVSNRNRNRDTKYNAGQLEANKSKDLLALRFYNCLRCFVVSVILLSSVTHVFPFQSLCPLFAIPSVTLSTMALPGGGYVNFFGYVIVQFILVRWFLGFHLISLLMFGSFLRQPALLRMPLDTFSHEYIHPMDHKTGAINTLLYDRILSRSDIDTSTRKRNRLAQRKHRTCKTLICYSLSTCSFLLPWTILKSSWKRIY